MYLRGKITRKRLLYVIKDKNILKRVPFSKKKF